MYKIKDRQKLRAMVLFFCILCLSVGCGKTEIVGNENAAEIQNSVSDKIINEDESEENIVIIDEAEQESISTELSETVTEEYGNDKITLLRKKVNDVSVIIPGNQDAQDKINAFFADRNRAFEDTVELYTNLVETAYYAWKDAEDSGEWKTYELGRNYTVKRQDEQMICVVEDSYVYTGGERTSYTRVSYNFDTWTGSRLSLEEAASHLDEIRTESIKYIGELLPESEYVDILKKDYTNHLEDILTDGTWYTDDKGLYVICNEDIITPAEEGIIEFFLPYDEVDVIDEIYIPEEKAD